MKSRLKAVLFTLLILGSVSCSVIFSTLYGVKKINGFDEKKYEKFISGIKDTSIDMYDVVIDSAQFMQIVTSDTSAFVRKNFSQPIQILYFDSAGKLISFQANCYAKGSLSNLDWNTNDRFNEFPPVSAVPANNLKTNINRYKTILNKIGYKKNKDYVIIIFWTRMFEKISREAILTVFDNIKKFNENDKAAVILVNTDYFFGSLN